MKHRYRNSIKDMQTVSGADIDSDQNLLAAKMCIGLKKITKLRKGNPGRIWRSYMLNDMKCKML